MELDCFFRILVLDDPKRNRCIDSNVQFFKQLPTQTFFQRFTLLPFATGKFPETRQVHTGATLGNQIPAVVKNQASGHFDDFGHHTLPCVLNGKVLQMGFMVQPWQDGVRAVQHSAPKSMIAWLKSYPFPGGMSASANPHNFAFCVFGSPFATKTRWSTRMTLVSRMGASSLNANDRIAPAV